MAKIIVQQHFVREIEVEVGEKTHEAMQEKMGQQMKDEVIDTVVGIARDRQDLWPMRPTIVIVMDEDGDLDQLNA